jgi:S-formylglutathione hydrolase FrmB
MRLSFKSEVLGRQTYVNIILPQDGGGKPLPVLYLLHGLGDDQDAWLRNSSIERYAEGRNLAIVMPATDRGFYTDTTYGIKHFTYICEELPKILGQYLPLSEKREENFTAGLSMGGYGALKLALRNPERFSFAAGLSGAYICNETIAAWEKEHDPDSDFARELHSIFGAALKPEDDIVHLLETASPKPKLFVCCGKDDFLFPFSLVLRARAVKLGYDLTWREDEGYDHVWEYWDLMIQDVLDKLVN